MTGQSVEFLLDVVTQGIGNFQMNTADVDLHTAISFALCEEQVLRPAAGTVRPVADHSNRLRSLDGAIPSDSRYFATVRRATWMPCASSKPAILLSLNGFFRASAATSF